MTKIKNSSNKKQRVIFCTYSSIYSSLVLNELLQHESIEVVGIINSTRLLKPSYNSLTGSIKFIQTTGWRYASYLFFITDLFTWLQPVSQLLTVHRLAKKNNIPLLDTVDINRQTEIQFIKAQQPDVLLSAHFNQLFKEEVLQLPKLAAINIHPSLLPDYKGVDPVFYALLNNEKTIGVTAHLIDETFDTGEILVQRSFVTANFNTVFDLNYQLFHASGSVAMQAIQRALKKQKSDQPQKEGRYDSWPDSRLVKRLRKQGNSLINPQRLLRSLRH